MADIIDGKKLRYLFTNFSSSFYSHLWHWSHCNFFSFFPFLGFKFVKKNIVGQLDDHFNPIFNGLALKTARMVSFKYLNKKK
jgi:hypothetical protein